MASALRQAMRYKLTPQQQAAIGTRFERFASSGPGSALENELAAYFRRRRRGELGIHLGANTSAADVARARAAGALGYSGSDSSLGGSPELLASSPEPGPHQLGVAQNPMVMTGQPVTPPPPMAMGGQPLAPLPPGTPLDQPPTVTGSTPPPQFAMGGQPITPAASQPAMGGDRTPLTAMMSAYYPPRRRGPRQFG